MSDTKKHGKAALFNRIFSIAGLSIGGVILICLIVHVKRTMDLQALVAQVQPLWLLLAALCIPFSESVDAILFYGMGKAAGCPMKLAGCFDAAYIGDTTQKTIYLTFDAGYENGSTAKILDTLQKHQAPGAFFLVGNYIQRNADLVRRMVKEGHTVGNHTMHHYNMSKLSDKAAFSKELQDLEALFKETTGQEMSKFYRPPQGIYSEENLQMAKDMGYKTVFWSLAYVDWNNDAQPSRTEAMSKLIPRTHPGAVVLLHSTSQTNAEILDELLTKWEEMGYRFGKIEELFPTVTS